MNLPMESSMLTVSNLSEVLQRGLAKSMIFYLYLKETEFRFNYYRDNLDYEILNKTLIQILFK
ncbi:MAG: hypothetical protein A4S08_03410 [Proteobacteria bacterium SG_bin4]|nr:MAG: hypothetical protein A4S08_03410 [Proteobacteria bacterium SG_bin4]